MRTARGKQSQLTPLTPIERGGTAETDGIAFVDLWRLDVQPARSHDLAVDDETLEGRRGRAEHASVHFSTRVDGDVHFVALADWTRARRKISDHASNSMSTLVGRTWKVASHFKPVGFLARHALDAEGIATLDEALGARDILQIPLALGIVDKVVLDVVERQLFIFGVRAFAISILTVVCEAARGISVRSRPAPIRSGTTYTRPSTSEGRRACA